jgi:hypothetical protein
MSDKYAVFDPDIGATAGGHPKGYRTAAEIVAEGGGGGGSQNLSQVLTVGNDAGNQDITNVSSLSLRKNDGSTDYVSIDFNSPRVVGFNNVDGSPETKVILGSIDDPSSDYQAANKHYVDQQIAGIGTPGLGAVLFQSGSASNLGIQDLLDPINPQDAATKNYVDGLFVAPNLQTVLTAGNDANNQGILNVQDFGTAGGGKITTGSGTNIAVYSGASDPINIQNVLDPINPQDAATKAYCDLVAGVGGSQVTKATEEKTAVGILDTDILLLETSFNVDASGRPVLFNACFDFVYSVSGNVVFSLKVDGVTFGVWRCYGVPTNRTLVNLLAFCSGLAAGNRTLSLYVNCAVGETVTLPYQSGSEEAQLVVWRV